MQSALAVAYILLIAYASLFPLTGWRIPDEQLWNFFARPWPRVITRSDLVVNVWSYLPLGLLMAWRLRYSLRPVGSILGATLTGILVALLMESLQIFLPSRVPSTADLLANALGTLLGATLAVVLEHRTGPAHRLFLLRQYWFLPGRAIDVGLSAVGLWMLSELSPLVPSLNAENIRRSLSPLWHALQEPSLFKPYYAAGYAFNVAGLGLLAAVLTQRERRIMRPFAALLVTVLSLKIFIIGRQLTMEALCGLIIGLLTLMLLKHLNRDVLLRVSILFILTGFAVAELDPGSGAFYKFNWIPLRSQVGNNINGLASILSRLWPFLALACLANLATPFYLRHKVLFGGGLLVLIFVFTLEWIQQFIPGRYGDITTVLFALAGWFLPWLYSSYSRPIRSRYPAESNESPYNGR